MEQLTTQLQESMKIKCGYAWSKQQNRPQAETAEKLDKCLKSLIIVNPSLKVMVSFSHFHSVHKRNVTMDYSLLIPPIILLTAQVGHELSISC